jgi:hypothetical protein
MYIRLFGSCHIVKAEPMYLCSTRTLGAAWALLELALQINSLVGYHFVLTTIKSIFISLKGKRTESLRRPQLHHMVRSTSQFGKSYS